MAVITVLSKQPPGGRCSLYMRYAETLRDRFGLAVEIRYCEGVDAEQAPAILLEGAVLQPGDGVIVSPEDLARSLGGWLDQATLTGVTELLNKTQEDWMEEWTHD